MDIQHFTYLLQGLGWTLFLAAIGFAGGIPFGILVALMRVSSSPWLRRAAMAWIGLFQGTPLLMQLFLAYFGLGLFGINVSPWVAASLALTLYSSAFLTEIWRGSVASVAKGQWEASAALALSLGEQLRHVIGPQALRVAVPPTVGFLVQVVKGTALASVIGFIELTKAGTMITNATFRPFTVYACLALMYFALCYPISAWSKSLERKLHGQR
jgi:polar amino acid transport system permease protein